MRLEDDLTRGERKMRWKIEEIAGEERKKGKTVWVGYGKIQKEGKSWKWDEEEGRLRDSRGKVWDGQRKEKRGRGKIRGKGGRRRDG